MVSRYKEELKRCATRLEALRATVGSIGSVITASAFAVIIGLAGLTIAEFGMLQTMGLALATAVFITLLAALTLNPALTSLFGRFMFWPSKLADTTKAVALNAHESKFWNRVANITTNHSLIISILVILVLAVPYYPYFKMSTSYDTLAELSDDSNSIKGFQILSGHFDIGNMMPSTLILTVSSGSATSAGALKEMEEITTKLLAIDGVSSVLSVVSPYGTGEPLMTLTVVGQLAVLLEQLNGALSGAASDPTAMFGTETTQMFQLLGVYLGELGAAFPAVTAEPSFINAVTILNNMSAALVTVEPEKIDMATLANLQIVFQTYTGEFVQALMGLGDYFRAQGNPYFIPQSLLVLYPELVQLVSTFISEDAQATRLIINLSDYPYSEAAIDTIEQIGLAIHNETDSQYFNIGEAAVGGTTSAMQDVRAVLESDFQKIMIVVLAGVFLVLCLLLRSIVAPFFILALVALTYGATMGVASWLFTDILGHGGVSFMVPIIVFVLMIALGADYNIFLMSRIREEAEDKPMKEAIRNAIKSTNSVIIACGLILGGTFAAMIVSPIQTMFQLGVAVAIGIFLEAFVVITLLLPAITNIFGRASWWPFGHKKLGIKKD
ncbi:MAG: MMPL family transporter [Dehalococcoidales bacterium]|nr:MMPL family transporter [Dehalococcoidales bacterium]